jgi:cupin 2 domain-containing protein
LPRYYIPDARNVDYLVGLHMNVKNVNDDIPSALPDELITAILKTRNFRMERIISQGHCSAPGFWYDQNEHEWIIVLSGSALLRFENESEPLELVEGSYMNIPAHVKHRVERTSPSEPTIWLAIHYRD